MWLEVRFKDVFFFLEGGGQGFDVLSGVTLIIFTQGRTKDFQYLGIIIKFKFYILMLESIS